ncbi:MAG TPA: DJ-1/PfpI family protein [Acidimicrobiales bacterium]|nr:DJ-1/PfpI family protein [Acidimicrobiales bacterium]
MRIVIPLFDGFTALDAVGPYEVLSRLPGAEIVWTALSPGPIRTEPGVLKLVADVATSEIDACDILVVPGGPSSRVAAEAGLADWVRAVHPTTQWTTSVCTGADILGLAGLLQGLAATTHWSATDRLADYGATYSTERVVVQGKIVTSAGVSSGIDMGLHLASLIAGAETAQAIQLGIEYDPQPPFDSGSVEKADPAIVERLRALIAARSR